MIDRGRGPLARGPGAVPDDTLGQVLLASHLLGADRAVANFGGGNTSAKGTATDHVGREQRVMWVKGSGSDLATMEREHFTPLRLEEMLPLFERDGDARRGHGRPPRPLPDRPGGAARVDRDAAARVRPGRPRPPHAPRRDQRARGHERRRAPRARVLRGRGRVDPVHPARASRWPGRSARRCAPTPALKLVVLAKHGLVVWGDTAEEAYRRTLEAINRAADFVNARTAGDAAVRRRRGRRRRRGGRARARCCARCCRRCAGRCRASGRRCSSSTRRRACSSSSCSRDAPELDDVGAACPDHLVHTKRLPLWIPFDPSSRGRGDPGRAGPGAGGGVPRRLSRLRRAPRATRTPSPRTPTRASC